MAAQFNLSVPETPDFTWSVSKYVGDNNEEGDKLEEKFVRSVNKYPRGDNNEEEDGNNRFVEKSPRPGKMSKHFPPPVRWIVDDDDHDDDDASWQAVDDADEGAASRQVVEDSGGPAYVKPDQQDVKN